MTNLSPRDTRRAQRADVRVTVAIFALAVACLCVASGALAWGATVT